MKTVLRNMCAVCMVLSLFLCILVKPSVAADDNKLYVFNWSEYIPQDVLDQFTKETGIEVVYTTYESNESMFAKLKLLDGKGYDVVVPSTYFVELMRDAGLLSPIDKSKLPNILHLDPQVLNQPFDPSNTYSMPYMWGVQGFMVNKKVVDPKEITSWNDLLRPEFKGKLLLSDDLRDTFGAALKATGASVNSTNPEEVKAAFEWLKAIKPHVRIFDVTAAKQALISEEVTAGLIWNGDAFIAQAENPNLVFIYPKEGNPLWMDTFVIPAKAENKENAHKFINFMLRPDIAAACLKEYNYSTPNKGVKALLDAEFAESDLIFPSKENIARSEFSIGIGEAVKMYEKYWEDLKIDSGN